MPSDSSPPRLDRRAFIAGTGAGLVLLLTTSGAHSAGVGLRQIFLQIDLDDTVTVFAKHLDMGQGIWSGLASIVAEELDSSWEQVRVVGAPTAPEYKHTRFGVQTTGGSTSIANSFDQLRKAGATARAMLVAAAAERWRMNPSEISVADGVVMGASREARFGDLAAAAARQTPVSDPVLKRPDQYRFLGKQWPRLDARAKVSGQLRFGIDLQLPDMKIAVLAWPPCFGAALRSFDSGKALAVRGVRQVVRTPQGVAVIADTTWSAIQGRGALQIDWDLAAGESRSSEDLGCLFSSALDSPGLIGFRSGDVDRRMSQAAQVIQADFHFPYLAHAAMEPLAAACQISPGGCELWGGFQSQTANQLAAAKILGLSIDKVRLNSLYAGGSFGRRASFDSDWIVALVNVTKASGLSVPIKLMWTREDDMRAGYYRPLSHHRMAAGLASDGTIEAVDQVVASQSVLFAGPYGDPALAKPDPTAYSGGLYHRYDVPAARLRWVSLKTGVPVTTFRGVSFNTTTFAKEVFMDELARTAKEDPLHYRLRHLNRAPRQAAVLRLAAEKAGWGRVMTAGRSMGLAVQEADDTFVAQVAEISIEDRILKVERVVCALDCGFALNPDNVRAQMEGGIGFAVSCTLYGEIGIRDGAVVQSNFHDYQLLHMYEMPKVEVHILNSDQAPTGVGEPGSNPTAAAIANAVARLTGRSIRTLPLTADLWSHPSMRNG